MELGNYNGGKGQIFRHLINLMPPHEAYIEPFLGGGSVMLNKRPAAVNIGIDKDSDVIDAWTRATHARNGDASATPDLAMAAAIAANGDTRCQFVCGDALPFLRSYPYAGRVLVYADPPYLLETRSRQRPLYRHEMTSQDDHTELLELLLSLPCMVMISGYWSPLYAEMLEGWETAVIPAYTRSGRAVEEWVWMNYEQPVRLHDYRYLGESFRERERIKRKATRWVERFKSLPALERQAIFAKLEEEGVL